MRTWQSRIWEWDHRYRERMRARQPLSGIKPHVRIVSTAKRHRYVEVWVPVGKHYERLERSPRVYKRDQMAYLKMVCDDYMQKRTRRVA